MGRASMQIKEKQIYLPKHGNNAYKVVAVGKTYITLQSCRKNATGVFKTLNRETLQEFWEKQ